MKYLNLTEGFDPNNSNQNNRVQFKYSVFNGGEPNIRITDNYIDSVIHISIRIQSFNDVGKLAHAVDALRVLIPNVKIYCTIPYFPGARQDRVCNTGEAFSCRVYASLINSLLLDKVVIYDPHSDVTPALINKCEVIDNYSFVRHCMHHLYDVGVDVSKAHIVSPDAGSSKKINSLVAALNTMFNFKFYSIIQCGKERNLSTGKLSGFRVYTDDLQGKDCVIIDDICDGGGTFIGLAKELKRKNAGKIILIVTHGIFSRGYELENIDYTYSSDSFDSLDKSASFNHTTINFSTTHF